MAKTNLNISPYFDDFDANKNFYKVLFKPGYPVQARELTTLQSILQNQISSLAKSIFKDGSVVIPGEVSYDPNYYAVKINPIHLGLDVEFYYKELIGKRLVGDISQITAVVQNVVSRTNSSENVTTLYIKYLNSNLNNENFGFIDGETLTTLDNVKYGNTTITPGNTIASLLDTNSTAIGSAVSISPGIYFIRGLFVTVDQDTIILDQYSNTPSYRVGLSVSETFMSSYDDSSLFDNAKGFTNYSAPGADRFRLKTNLSKQLLTDFEDTNFIEILRITDGVVRKIKDSSDYSLIRDYISKRTYEQSGNFALSPFSVFTEDSLNNLTDQKGIFKQNQTTEQNNAPSEDLFCVKISSGKAYVNGNDIEKSSTTILDARKTRSVNTISNSPVSFEMGSLIVLNNVSGSPAIGLNNNYEIKLFDNRKSSNIAGSGTTIGKARVYSFSVSDSVYENQSSRWNLYLYDLQTYTTITVNSNVTNEVTKSSFVKGLSSGASGYVAESPNNGNIISLYQTSGSFIKNEQIIFNNNKNVLRTVEKIIVHNPKDIKSVYQKSSDVSLSGLSTDFSADVFLQKNIAQGFGPSDNITIQPAVSGISTVISPGKLFVGIKTDSIIRYQVSGFSTETYNRVVSISEDGLSMNVVGVTTVPNVCVGSLPSGSAVSATFSLGESTIKNKDRSNLYINLPNKDISSVDLSSSTITLKRQVSQKSTSSSGTLSLSISGDFSINSGYFEPFIPERYSIFYGDGTIENLTSDKVQILNNGLDISFSGLKSSQSGNVSVICTITKNSIRNKTKIYKKSQKLSITKTSLGISNGISGLTTSAYYGTRVEDEEISLNVPDASEILAIYESSNSESPILDKLSFPSQSISGAIVGEKIYGSSSEAVGQIVDVQGSDINFVYLNSNKFQSDDIVNFEESKILSSLLAISPGVYINKTNDFTLDKGQKDQYYDYSKIVRNFGSNSPAKKLLIIFNYFEVSESDSGDLYTANSYNSSNFKNDIPILKNGYRSSDVLDFRPRVSKFKSESSSPFDFSRRNFSTSQSNIQIVVSPNESTRVSYSHYIPRIDKLVLNKNGNFQIITGASSINPQEPSSLEDAMDIARIEIPAYVYNVEDIKVFLIENKRYTMKDIGTLENRIKNLENFASLSLLELDVKSLQIIDNDGLGLSKFKCGFFADSFINSNLVDYKNPDARLSINAEDGEMSTDVSITSLKTQILPSQGINLESTDYSQNLDLVDANVKKTGDLVTLNYSEIEWGDVSQPFATTIENINPHGLSDYNGNVRLRPSTDCWVKTINPIKGKVIRTQSEWKNNYLSNLYLSGEIGNKIRSRNIEFFASNLYPLSRYTPYFDGSTSFDVIPKLLKISMTTGIFAVGETVDGYEGNVKVFSARLCTPNHKYGPYNSPSETYTVNPYQTAEFFTDYSQSTVVLNIDTYSLADSADGRFFGYISYNMVLVGRASGAQCTVINQNLISDTYGDLIGCFFIRNPFSSLLPSNIFSIGDKTFKLQTADTAQSTSSIQIRPGLCESTLYLSENSNFSNNSIIRRPVLTRSSVLLPKSYLSQTFKIDNSGGFLSSIDLFFASKDTNEKVTIEIGEVDLGGTPTDKLLQDFARVQLLPSQINTSTDGQSATNVKLPSPLYLEPNKQYCVRIYSPSSSLYSVWTAVSNEATVQTQNYPNSQQVIYSNQFIGGNLYKPQNGAIPSPSLLQDLKFKLYKAQFVSAGTVFFTNPILSDTSSSEIYDSNNDNLVSNPITGLPLKYIVGITTSYANDFYTFGKKIQFSNGNYGFIEKSGGKISGVTTTNVGLGYSNGVYSDVPLFTINGFGPNVIQATANLTFTNGKLSGTQIVNSGKGYSKGDLLGIATGYNPKGTGALISVSNLNGIDTLLLTNIPTKSIQLGNTLSYFEPNGTQVSLAGTTVIETPKIFSDLYDGRTFKVDHYNHSMHDANNYITISGVFPDTTPVELVSSITSQTNTISIANTSTFNTYDGASVAGINTGYALINNEIFAYSSVSAGTLQISSRGVNGSIIRNHNAGDMVYKYECNNVSLMKINTTHRKSSSQYLKSFETSDSYYLKFASGESSNSIFAEEKAFGGSNCKITQNYQYNSIIPKFNILTPPGTSLNSSIRTISGTSASGSELSFADQGLLPLSLNSRNDFDSPKLIASRINEINNVSGLARLKSMLISLTLRTRDPNVSPVVDVTEGATVALIRNKLNTPISNYISDNRSNLLINDPHSSIYISNTITLLKPASSLKVITNCYKSSSNDFRILYKLIRPDSSEVDQTYEFFPGYNNLKDINGDGIGDTIIDTSLNDGTSDFYVGTTAEGEYSEYEFTANNLGEFVGFVIKVVMSGSNEARPLKFKDIRAIALA
jgi:hypothetical protein